MAESNFDISKYITAQDVVAAVAAGAVAYLTYRTKQDEPTPEQPKAVKPKTNPAADPTVRIDRGTVDINDPKLWKDGGIVNMNGNQLHVFRAPDGSVIRVNPYQLQAAGGDPMKAAMNQFAAKVQNGQVDMDKLFAAGGTTATRIPSRATITDKALADEFLSGPSPTSVWKPDGSFDISAVHWKSVPGRGMVPFGPDKQPLTGKALVAAQQLHRRAVASIQSSMNGRPTSYNGTLVNTLSDF